MSVFNEASTIPRGGPSIGSSSAVSSQSAVVVAAAEVDSPPPSATAAAAAAVSPDALLDLDALDFSTNNRYYSAPAKEETSKQDDDDEHKSQQQQQQQQQKHDFDYDYDTRDYTTQRPHILASRASSASPQVQLTIKLVSNIKKKKHLNWTSGRSR
eukprot:scaffold19320_cov242-Skeletonema_marinoi.AAC.1